jgi:hypothetical protein
VVEFPSHQIHHLVVQLYLHDSLAVLIHDLVLVASIKVVWGNTNSQRLVEYLAEQSVRVWTTIGSYCFLEFEFYFILYLPICVGKESSPHISSNIDFGRENRYTLLILNFPVKFRVTANSFLDVSDLKNCSASYKCRLRSECEPNVDIGSTLANRQMLNTKVN